MCVCVSACIGENTCDGRVCLWRIEGVECLPMDFQRPRWRPSGHFYRIPLCLFLCSRDDRLRPARLKLRFPFRCASAKCRGRASVGVRELPFREMRRPAGGRQRRLTSSRVDTTVKAAATNTTEPKHHCLKFDETGFLCEKVVIANVKYILSGVKKVLANKR